jgi:hypothetical protein
MKNLKPFSNLTYVATLLFLLFLSACTMPARESGLNLSAQIVQPLDGTRVQLGSTVEIQTRVSTQGTVRSVALQINGQTDREDLFANPAFHSGTVYQQWTPPSVGTYVLQVILKDAEGQVSSNVLTIIVVEATVITLTPQTNTPGTLPGIFTITPTLLTPPPEDPQVTGDQEVNCRRGPSTAYNAIGVLAQGQTAPIAGRNQDNSWYYILLDSLQCWVWSGAVSVTGNVNSQPLVEAPPLPVTVTPSVTTSPPPAYSACHDYPDYATCNSDPMGFGGCYWDTGMNQCAP